MINNVLWIGGRSGSGKSTIARLLARRRGLRWHSCDTRTWDHLDRAIAAGDPTAIEWGRLSPQQRSRLSQADKIRLTIDRSAMVLDDVAALPATPAIIAEGTNIVPSMVPRKGMAVWLIADPIVRATRTQQRGWGAGGGEVDMILERELNAELKQTSARVINTSNHGGPSETIDHLEAIAADWLAARPVARTRAERQTLIRDGIAAIAAQHRRGMARAGNTTGAGEIPRTYDCECGSTECTAFVERLFDNIANPLSHDADPILAPGHNQGR